MRHYQCSDGCKCPNCDPANQIEESLGNIAKSLKMKKELAAARAADPEEGDRIMRELGIGPWKSF